MLAAVMCLVLGDSIATKIAELQPQCDNASQKGLQSAAIVDLAPPDRGYRRVIVSMGTNDRAIRALPANLAAVRAKYPHAQFTWLAPIKPVTGTVVVSFARSRGDRLVELSAFPTRDRMHPLSYVDVNRLIN